MKWVTPSGDTIEKKYIIFLYLVYTSQSSGVSEKKKFFCSVYYALNHEKKSEKKREKN